MNTTRVKMSVTKGGLAGVGVILISTGVGLIEEGETIIGGILAGLGAILIIVGDYIGR